MHGGLQCQKESILHTIAQSFFGSLKRLEALSRSNCFTMSCCLVLGFFRVKLLFNINGRMGADILDSSGPMTVTKQLSSRFHALGQNSRCYDGEIELCALSGYYSYRGIKKRYLGYGMNTAGSLRLDQCVAVLIAVTDEKNPGFVREMKM
jgi:hypothetical protein